ncbi:AMP-dependent synthetase [Gardnerella swidsinskii]|uniref:AMP-dependent synthetase n=1 Tax=Gardnerella swidsinskii TaxID=2792979 RepID=UPI000E2E4C04|nr:AMP-dependent synthetase [Gardnerella vaginalis]
MIRDAEIEHRCILPINSAQKQYAYRCVKKGTFVRTFRNLYSQTDYWQKLYTSERIRHVALSLMDLYPDWKFTVTSGAALLGYDVVEDYDALFVGGKYDSHNTNLQTLPTQIYIRSKTNKSTHDNPQLHRIRAIGTEQDGTSDDVHIVQPSRKYDGRLITLPHLSDRVSYEIRSHVVDKSTLLFDAANSLSFRAALPIFDSAARDNVNFNKVLEICGRRYGGRDGVGVGDAGSVGSVGLSGVAGFGSNADPIFRLRRLCLFKNGLSENGGESFARGTMIDLGFMVPELQHEFVAPNSRVKYRCDFLWRVSGGGLIVGELDGYDKYFVDSTNSTHANINFNSSFDTQMLRNSYNQAAINRNIDRQAERESVLFRECGVSKIVRFNFADVVGVKNLERKLVEAGVPRIMRVG